MPTKFEQMEFDFSDPAKPEPIETFRVEITRGWDGDETEVKTDFTGTHAGACGVVATYGKLYDGFREVWSFHDLRTHEVIDFGSHFYFGRLTRV